MTFDFDRMYIKWNIIPQVEALSRPEFRNKKVKNPENAEVKNNTLGGSERFALVVSW